MGIRTPWPFEKLSHQVVLFQLSAAPQHAAKARRRWFWPGAHDGGNVGKDFSPKMALMKNHGKTIDIHPQMVIFHRKTHRKMVVLWDLMGFTHGKSHGKTMTGWWLSPTPLKNMSSSIGMMTFPTEWKKTSSKPPTRIGIESTI